MSMLRQRAGWRRHAAAATRHGRRRAALCHLRRRAAFDIDYVAVAHDCFLVLLTLDAPACRPLTLTPPPAASPPSPAYAPGDLRRQMEQGMRHDPPLMEAGTPRMWSRNRAADWMDD